MPWFKVDDGLAFHPKAIAAGNSAMGLWVRAGAWCSAHLTEGALPKHMIGTLGAQRRDTKRLVEAGLWVETADGFQFVDWDDYQPTKQQVEAERESNRERQKRFREKRRSTEDNGGSNGVTNGATNRTPTRPDPTRPSIGYVEEGSYVGERARENLPPSPHCPKHPGGTTSPCRACGDARKAHERLAEQNLADDKRARSERARLAAEARAQAIAHCNLCDDDGYRDALPCDHDPDSEDRAKRGIALVRETLANRGVA